MQQVLPELTRTSMLEVLSQDYIRIALQKVKKMDSSY